MSLGRTHRMLQSSEGVERDLAAARSGERPVFTAPAQDEPCEKCDAYRVDHVLSSTIPFCPEWALREAWGR